MRRAGLHLIAVAALTAAALLALFGAGERPAGLTDWQAFTLGVVQGVTELLPISSSGHLILVPWLADWHFLEQHEADNKTFDVALHLGTLVAVVLYFRGDLSVVVRAWLRSVANRRVGNADERLAWFLVAATLPAAVVGAVFGTFIENELGEPWQIAVLLAVFAVVLWAADRRSEERGLADLSLVAAVTVGLAQVLALAPGVSRSGITISAGRFLGLDRDAAARLSFLLLVPIVFGAVVWKGFQDVVFGDLPPGSTGPFVIGTVAAAGSGLLSISALLAYVRRHDYTPFAVYRLLVAAAVLLVIASGAREAMF